MAYWAANDTKDFTARVYSSIPAPISIASATNLSTLATNQANYEVSLVAAAL